MPYHIISIEGRNVTAERRVLFVKANPVKEASERFRFMEKLFGKKYYNYSHNECDDTVCFVYLFSEERLQQLMQAYRSSQDPTSFDSFWNPDLKEFTCSELYDSPSKKRMMFYKHQSLTKTEYEFCLITEVLPTTIKNERIFLVHTNRTEVGKREAFLNDFSQGKICYFVLAVSEYNRFKEETAQAFWRPNLSHYIYEELEMSGVNHFTGEPMVETRYMYISRDVSHHNIMNNLNNLPL